jgi:DNA-binding transcriptional ArsR family regulator
MARSATTTDAFSAVAEVSRRDLLDAIGDGEVTVGELVTRLGLSQPQVSKHLGVLRSVGLVLVRVDGRHRWYRVNGDALRPISDWVRRFERTWNRRLDRLDDVLAELRAARTTDDPDQPHHPSPPDHHPTRGEPRP